MLIEINCKIRWDILSQYLLILCFKINMCVLEYAKYLN